jgi:hypothetical protein
VGGQEEEKVEDDDEEERTKRVKRRRRRRNIKLLQPFNIAFNGKHVSTSTTIKSESEILSARSTCASTTASWCNRFIGFFA